MSLNNTCIVLSCCTKKQKTPALAKDMYLSPLFKSCRSVAEQSGFDWFILSAEYGLIHPELKIKPYSTVFKLTTEMKRGCIKRGENYPKVQPMNEHQELKRVANSMLCSYNRRIYLLGKEYMKYLLPGENPFDGLFIGQRQQQLASGKTLNFIITGKL